MTRWVRDCSDYDPDPITVTGLDGVTHKATEGTMPHADAEGTKLAARLNAARAAGVPVLGAYHVLRTPGNGGAGSLPAQLAYWVARLDDQVPWWRTWPNWVMQVDAEKWPYDPDMAANVLEFARLLAGSGLPGWKVTYASRGQYGDSLAGISTPLWNADYPGGGVYPGDDWAPGWAPYSSQTPVLLQFAGGPDMNAFRGSLADLLNLTGGDMGQPFLNDPNAAALAWREEAETAGADTVQGGPTAGEPDWEVQTLKAILAQAQANGAALSRLTAPVPAAVDTHAVATDLEQQLLAGGLLTSDTARPVIKSVLDAAFAGAAAA